MKRESLIWTVILVLAGAYLLARLTTGGMGYAFVERAGDAWVEATPSEAAAGAARFDLSRTVGLWVAAVMTLCIFSFLYRDNPAYKLAEAIVVGVSAAYAMVVAYWTTLVPNLFGKLFPAWVQSWAIPGLAPVHEDGWWLYFVPLILGVMLLWRLAPRGGWISRWPLALVIGATAGLRLIGFLQADFIGQIRGGIEPLLVMEAGGWQVSQTVSNVLTFLGVLACLVYFFFSFEHKGAVGKVARVGIWVLMITFGAAFGYTVMGRIALLAIRFEFLLDDWLWLIDPTGDRVGY